jgi:cell division septation protein DedD
VDTRKTNRTSVSENTAAPIHGQTALWLPGGQSYPFEPSAIEAHAPAGSGVYGLHDESQQIFIGEAASLRDTLLRHLKDPQQLFRHRQPKYFSYWECRAEACGERARGLIAKYQPALQGVQLLAFATAENGMIERPSDSWAAKVGRFVPGARRGATDGSSENDPAKSHLYITTTQVSAIAGAFLLLAVALAYLGMRTGEFIAGARNVTPYTAEVDSAIATEPEPAAALEDAKAVARRAPDALSEIQPQPAAATASGAMPAAPVAAPVKSTEPPVEEASRQPSNATIQAKPIARPSTASDSRQEPGGKSWTIQISATQVQATAEAIRDKLRAKGYEAFVAEAEINGALWYRLRIGSFASAQSADALRQTLMEKENLRAAFVTAK